MTNKKNGLASMGGVTPSGDHNNAIGGDKRKPKNKGVSARPGFLGASADNDADAITETNRIIFQTMLSEARTKVMEKVRRHKKPKDVAIQEVAADMDMTFAELDALKSDPELQDVEPEVEPTVEPEAPEQTGLPNTITFGSAEEVSQAVGILMYKSIPWADKSQFSIRFDDKATLDSAHEALKRRWDFVETSERTVAVIEFDNLGDYDRVLDFMQKQGMLLDFRSNSDLSEDLIDAAKAANVPVKGKKAKPINEDDITPADNSYTAVNKDKKITPKDVNVWDNRSQRAVKSRKRWK